jgi:hypothetical protein
LTAARSTARKFFWDASAESLGIGTSSPATKLEVLGSSNSNYLRLSGDDAAGARGLDFTSFTVNANAGAGHQINAKSIHGTLTFATSNTERLRITSTGSCEWRPDGTTQAMTLDASGNLLVGKTSAAGADINVVGNVLKPTGANYFTATSDGSIFNRLTTDGTIIDFRKNGTTVGSIGSTGGTGEVYIANNDSVGLKFTNVDAIVPSTHTGGGANRDAAIDLGYSSGGTNVRFKDLYLSGGLRGDTTFKNNAGTTEYARFDSPSSEIIFFQYPNDSWKERLRVDASGNLLVGKTSSSSTVVGTALCSFGRTDMITSGGVCSVMNRQTSTGTILEFQYANGVIGTISTNGSTTAYNTSSDYRLKENVAPMQNALDTVAQLNPVTYTWKADGSAGQGFIAHELQAVVPDCVTGEKDAVDADGKPKYQGVDTSFLVGILTKAIQEQQTTIAALEARITALEA